MPPSINRTFAAGQALLQGRAEADMACHKVSALIGGHPALWPLVPVGKLHLELLQLAVHCFAGQMRKSPYSFSSIGDTSPLLWLARRYAILDGPTMPIVAEGDEEPNNTYVEQLTASAQAAVQAGPFLLAPHPLPCTPCPVPLNPCCIPLEADTSTRGHYPLSLSLGPYPMCTTSTTSTTAKHAVPDRRHKQ